MDTQINLRLDKYLYDNTPLRTEGYLIDVNKDCVFTIDETDKVYATFDYDSSNVIIELEDCLSGEMIRFLPKEKNLLSDGSDEIHSYFAGYFSIRIIINGTVYDRFFLVKPRNASYETVLNIRDFINGFYNGLSLDLLKKRSSFDNEAKKKVYSSYNSFLFLLQKMPQLINITNQYLEKRNCETIKVDELSSSSKKTASRTIKWLARKGMTVNKNINAPDVLLIRKTRVNLDNKANRIFKSHLIFWNNELGRNIHNLQKYISLLQTEIDSMRNNYASLDNHYQEISTDRKIARSVKKSVAGQINDLTKDIEEKENLKNEYEMFLKKIRHYKTYFEYTIYNTWIKDINPSSHGDEYSSDYQIAILQRIKNEYYGFKQRTIKKSGKNEFIFSEKSTPKLFETYIYVLIISILRKHGLEFSNIDFEADDIMYKLSTSGSLVLSNGEIQCRIIYDVPLKRSNAKFDENEYTTVNSKHNRPDFILSFMDAENNIIDTIIIEAKWRALSYIYNEADDTEIVETLKDYFNLGYHDHLLHKTLRSVVSKVLVLYPNTKETVTYIQNEEIIAFGFLPDTVDQNSSFESTITDLILSESIVQDKLVV